jgi:hypothetical protein
VITQILLLPTELLLHIASYFTDIRDIISLCLTCQTLQRIAQRQLYRHVDTRPPLISLLTPRDEKIPSQFNAPKHYRLFLTLQKPAISPLVTTLKLTLPECTRDTRSSFLELWTGWSDWCRTLGAQLELALVGLTSLEVLDIVCDICPAIRSDDGRRRKHEYLEKLGTRRLKQLYFRCNSLGGEYRDSTQTRMILSAPCLQSITSLGWEIPSINSGSRREEAEDEVLLKDCLPHLERLRYNVNPLLDRLLEVRNISHLECRGWDKTLHGALCSHASKPRLVFLLTDEESRYGPYGTENWEPSSTLVGLARGITENPRPYRNLRHVGMLLFRVTSVSGLVASAASLWILTFHVLQKIKILEYTKIFAALPHLFSIQAENNLHGQRAGRRYSNRVADPWEEDLLINLSLQHENLRRVYLYVRWMHLQESLTFRSGDLTWVLNERWVRKETPLLTIEDIAQAIRF